MTALAFAAVTALLLSVAGCRDPIEPTAEGSVPPGITPPVPDDVIFSDHGFLGPSEEDITDFHAFVSGQNLVLAISTNSAIPRDADSYIFPPDVIFEVNVDNHSEVVDDAMDPYDVQLYGGTIVDPEGISEDVTFRIRFHDDGAAFIERIAQGQLQGTALATPNGKHLKTKSGDPQIIDFFAGLRDDPFIRNQRVDGRPSLATLARS